MKIRIHTRFAGLLSLIFLLTVTEQAQAQAPAFKFEIAPIAGYRFGGKFHEKEGDGEIELRDSEAIGFALNLTANPNGQYELIYARQSTDADTLGFFVNDPVIDLDVEYLQIGGTYLFDGNSTRPFLALGVGVSRFDPSLTDASAESYFSASFGAGIQLAANKRFGVRLEARAFTTFVDEDSTFFCSSDAGAGSCLVQVDAKTLTQWEARAGLVFRF